MVDNLDAGLEANIRQNFTRFLASSPPLPWPGGT